MMCILLDMLVLMLMMMNTKEPSFYSDDVSNLELEEDCNLLLATCANAFMIA